MSVDITLRGAVEKIVEKGGDNWWENESTLSAWGTELSASYVDTVCHLDTSPSVSLCCQMVFPLVAFITIYSYTIGGWYKKRGP